MKPLICIPTYNEIDNVELIATAIFEHVETDIVFIDDGSPDGTGRKVDALAAANPRIHAIHRPAKLGLGTAYIKAFHWGLERGYDVIFEMDADFSHDPAHLPSFFRALAQGADAVCGCRYMKGGGVSNWDKRRLLLSRGGSLYTFLWLWFGIRDWTGGFNAWRSEVLRNLSLDTIQSKGYTFQIEMKYRALVKRFNVCEIPIVFQERRAGASKMSGSIVKEALWGVLRLRFRKERGQLFSRTNLALKHES